MVGFVVVDVTLVVLESLVVVFRVVVVGLGVFVVVFWLVEVS